MKTKDRRNIKAKVIIDMSMSLDGFIAGPDGYARIAPFRLSAVFGSLGSKRSLRLPD